MHYIEEIQNYRPVNAQEEKDKETLLRFVLQNESTVLTRDNETAHITSSGFILNAALTKALLVHHDIRGVWAWAGGHADGNGDLLQVALKEAREETGLIHVHAQTGRIAGIDILPVYRHKKRGAYISAHLHLSIAYILVASEADALQSRPGENTGVRWFPVEVFTREHFDASDVTLYNKLIERARMDVERSQY